MFTIQFDIPKKMRDLAQVPGIQERPYDICFECPFRGKTCDGPNEQAMEMPRRIEWFNRLAKERGLSRSEAAEEAGLPLATVNSIMAGRTLDPRHSTMQALSKVYSGGCWGQYPCHLAALLLNGELLEADFTFEDAKKIDELTQEVAKLRAREESAIAHVEADSQRKVEYLKDLVAKQEKKIESQEQELKKERGRLMKMISVAAILSLIIIVALVIDKLNPNMGFFWLG